MFKCSNYSSSYLTHQNKCDPKNDEFLIFYLDCNNVVDYVTLNIMIKANIVHMRNCNNNPKEIIYKKSFSDKRLVDYLFPDEVNNNI